MSSSSSSPSLSSSSQPRKRRSGTSPVISHLVAPPHGPPAAETTSSEINQPSAAASSSSSSSSPSSSPSPSSTNISPRSHQPPSSSTPSTPRATAANVEDSAASPETSSGTLIHSPTSSHHNNSNSGKRGFSKTNSTSKKRSLSTSSGPPAFLSSSPSSSSTSLSFSPLSSSSSVATSSASLSSSTTTTPSSSSSSVLSTSSSSLPSASASFVNTASPLSSLALSSPSPLACASSLSSSSTASNSSSTITTVKNSKLLLRKKRKKEEKKDKKKEKERGPRRLSPRKHKASKQNSNTGNSVPTPKTKPFARHNSNNKKESEEEHDLMIEEEEEGDHDEGETTEEEQQQHQRRQRRQQQQKAEEQQQKEQAQHKEEERNRQRDKEREKALVKAMEMNIEIDPEFKLQLQQLQQHDLNNNNTDIKHADEDDKEATENERHKKAKQTKQKIKPLNIDQTAFGLRADSSNSKSLNANVDGRDSERTEERAAQSYSSSTEGSRLTWQIPSEEWQVRHSEDADEILEPLSSSSSFSPFTNKNEEEEIRNRIHFLDCTELLRLVTEVRGISDNAAIRILQRHLEELYLLKHILYERSMHLDPLLSVSPETILKRRFKPKEQTTSLQQTQQKHKEKGKRGGRGAKKVRRATNNVAKYRHRKETVEQELEEENDEEEVEEREDEEEDDASEEDDEQIEEHTSKEKNVQHNTKKNRLKRRGIASNSSGVESSEDESDHSSSDENAEEQRSEDKKETENEKEKPNKNPANHANSLLSKLSSPSPLDSSSSILSRLNSKQPAPSSSSSSSSSMRPSLLSSTSISSLSFTSRPPKVKLTPPIPSAPPTALISWLQSYSLQSNVPAPKTSSISSPSSSPSNSNIVSSSSSSSSPPASPSGSFFNRPALLHSPPSSPSSSSAFFSSYLLASNDVRRWTARATRKIYAAVNYHDDILQLYQRCIDVLEFADLDTHPPPPHHLPPSLSNTASVHTKTGQNRTSAAVLRELGLPSNKSLRGLLKNQLYFDLGEYFLWKGDYVESVQALANSLKEDSACLPALSMLLCALRFLPDDQVLETSAALAQIPADIPARYDAPIIRILYKVVREHRVLSAFRYRYQALDWAIRRLHYLNHRKCVINRSAILKLLVCMHKDSNKQLRIISKAAVRELGDRLLRIRNSSDGEVFTEFRICSVVLKEKSEYFRRMFESEMLESAPEACINIFVETPRMFNDIIEYFYTDQLEVNAGNAVELLLCANQFGISYLLRRAEDYLCRNLLHKCSVREIESLYTLVAENVVSITRLVQSLLERLMYFLERSIRENDLPAFLHLGETYPPLRKRLESTQEYLCLALYKGHKEIALAMLKWGIGVSKPVMLPDKEAMEKEKEKEKDKDKLKSATKTKKKSKAKKAANSNTTKASLGIKEEESNNSSAQSSPQPHARHAHHSFLHTSGPVSISSPASSSSAPSSSPSFSSFLSTKTSSPPSTNNPQSISIQRIHNQLNSCSAPSLLSPSPSTTSGTTATSASSNTFIVPSLAALGSTGGSSSMPNLSSSGGSSSTESSPRVSPFSSHEDLTFSAHHSTSLPTNVAAPSHSSSASASINPSLSVTAASSSSSSTPVLSSSSLPSTVPISATTTTTTTAPAPTQSNLQALTMTTTIAPLKLNTSPSATPLGSPSNSSPPSPRSPIPTTPPDSPLIIDTKLRSKEKEKKGWESPLIIAIRRSYADIVRLLIEGGADVHAETSSSSSSSSLSTSSLLSASSSSAPSSSSGGGKTPLEIAVKRGTKGAGSEIVALLVDAGCDVNHRKNARIRARKENTQPVFHEDMYVVHFDREKYNPKYDIHNTIQKEGTPLMIAAYYGHTASVEILLAGGAEVDLSTENMNTALMIAALQGHMEVVNKLLEAEANVNKCNLFMWKALHFAAYGGHADIVIKLLEMGTRDSLAIYSTDSDQRNPKCKTAQEMALEAGKEAVVKVFTIHKTKIPKYLNEKEHKKKRLEKKKESQHSFVAKRE